MIQSLIAIMNNLIYVLILVLLMGCGTKNNSPISQTEQGRGQKPVDVEKDENELNPYRDVKHQLLIRSHLQGTWKSISSDAGLEGDSLKIEIVDGTELLTLSQCGSGEMRDLQEENVELEPGQDPSFFRTFQFNLDASKFSEKWSCLTPGKYICKTSIQISLKPVSKVMEIKCGANNNFYGLYKIDFINH